MTALHRAKRSLGQNFLTDPNTQRRIVQALDPQPDDVVIEIGPGMGALTSHIAGHVQRLILIELDDDLALRLATQYQNRDDVRVIHEDVLAVDLCTAARADHFKIVGNIPYNITTPIIFKLLERDCRPDSIVLMVQKEVADRVASGPDNKTYGALSVGVQALADVEKLFTVSRGAFRPAPNVDSAVMRIVPHDPPRLSAGEEIDLRRLTRTTFGWRRKQLQKILRSAPDYLATQDVVSNIEAETGIRMDARPETLAPHDFIRLSRALRAAGLPAGAANETDSWE